LPQPGGRRNRQGQAPAGSFGPGAGPAPAAVCRRRSQPAPAAALRRRRGGLHLPRGAMSPWLSARPPPARPACALEASAGRTADEFNQRWVWKCGFWTARDFKTRRSRCSAGAARRGLVRVRPSISARPERRTPQSAGVIEAVLRGMERATRHGITCGLVVDLIRNRPRDARAARRDHALPRPGGVRRGPGGSEVRFPPAPSPPSRGAAQRRFHRTHAGRWLGPRSEAFDQRRRRVDRGIRAIQDPALVARRARRCAPRGLPDRRADGRRAEPRPAPARRLHRACA
jgi:hypothetical protein